MLKTAIAMGLFLGAAGCAATPDASTSEDAVSAPKDTLAAAQAEVAAVRATFEPDGAHELLFDPGLAPAYIAAVRPIFARTAPTDQIPLAGDAFTYVSAEIQQGAVLGGGVLDHAVAASYSDLRSISFYFGGLSAEAAFWSDLNGFIARSKAGQLSDLQVLELVTTAKPTDFVDGLDALGWTTAPDATVANAKLLVDAPQTFTAVSNLLFGEVQTVASGTTHDIAADDTFGAQLFTRTFSKVRLLGGFTDPGDILVDLGGHFKEAKEDTHASPTRGLTLATNALTQPELRILDLSL